MTPTDTPQNACPHCGAEESRIKFSLRTLQTLVMSLTDRSEKAEAEVAKLNHQLLKAENDLLQSQDINSFLDTEFRIACKRAERAEAEVEMLDHLLAYASETNHKLQAEVLVLKKQVAALRSEKDACLAGNGYYANKIVILRAELCHQTEVSNIWKKRAERAEAKTERLKEQLESTQNLCLKFWSVLEEHGFELEINQ